MGEQSLSSEQGGGDEPLSNYWTTDREHYVIVVPDSMKTDPPDAGWIRENDTAMCFVTRLGRRMAYVLWEGDESAYCDLLLKMIAAGAKVIHQASLAEVNAKYLELHPNAEGIPILRPKSER